ncbi:MAG: meso-butanediol dehydrogenase / (S,S)-butanediol dehydrogenase / diacetyl reductase [Gaiellaceae bacterium]|jgi:NAD(P)-dependent dehydrogenase (short-subunit alcohol dehydrogenase family)|nr:meso-butanediol dehydrogenase / (S,S)-butanediol dehydrogenase / diacetyl reductase [Gaiellaceae bacterium]
MGKSALVTGGSSGIGLAIARMLREEGFELTLTARTRSNLESAARELDATAIPGDVSREEDCTRMVTGHGVRHGGLDLLVNSAGVGVGGSLETLSVKQLDLALTVNLRGAFLVTQAALPLLKASRGLVVNVASIAGTIPAPRLGAYAASKAGLISLTRTINVEHAADGIRATALCPDFVDTPMTAPMDLPPEQMIRAEDCAEVVRMLLRLSQNARIPQIVVERPGGYL